MAIFSVYDPTLNSGKDITVFYHDRWSTLTSIPNTEKILLLGNFNTCVGYDWGAQGKHDLGKMNSNGLHLQLCIKSELVICHTIFQQM